MAEKNCNTYGIIINSPFLLYVSFYYIAGYMIYGHFTHKDVLLSTAFVNVSPGNTLAEKLGSGFLDYIGGNDAKEEVQSLLLS